MRVAFLTRNAYDMLTNRDDGTVGGAQLQQILIGKSLADYGHEVFFIENDAPFKSEKMVEGINVRLKHQSSQGFMPVRAAKSSLSTYKTLENIDPDICYRRVLNFDLFPLYWYCRSTGTKFVYGIAHDSEVTDNPNTFDRPVNDNPIYKGLIKHILSKADHIVAQNQFQKRQAQQAFGHRVTRIPNGYPSPSADIQNLQPTSMDTDRPVILWVGTLRSWKQPGLVLELADEIPGGQFVIVGGPAEDEPGVSDKISAGADERDNVEFVGFVPPDEVDRYFAAADIFLNTSTEEGFPNTFLQAWAYQTPVVSLNTNPDRIITENGLGCVGDGSRKKLVHCLEELIEDVSKRRAQGRAACDYFESHHSISRVAAQYEQLFEQILNG